MPAATITVRTTSTVAAALLLPFAGPLLGAHADTRPAARALTGTVHADGRAASGSQIVVRAWPSNEQLTEMPDGQSFDLVDVAVTTADTRGQYTVDVDPAQLPDGYVGEDGAVNLEVIAVHGQMASAQSVTALAPGSRAATVAAQAAGDSTAPAGWTTAAAFGVATTAARSDAGDVTAASGGGCTTTTGGRHGPYLETFARMYGTANVKGRVIQASSASHTLGVGVKASGSSTWSASGTQTRSTGWGYDTGRTIVDAAVKNKVYHRYYDYVCMVDGKYYTTRYTRPDSFYAAGPYYSQVAHTNYTTCDPGYKDHVYTRQTNQNGAFGAGVDLPFINLSAQAGWTSTVTMEYKFFRAGKICGSGGQAWGAAPRVSTTA